MGTENEASPLPESCRPRRDTLVTEGRLAAVSLVAELGRASAFDELDRVSSLPERPALPLRTNVRPLPDAPLARWDALVRSRPELERVMACGELLAAPNSSILAPAAIRLPASVEKRGLSSAAPVVEPTDLTECSDCADAAAAAFKLSADGRWRGVCGSSMRRPARSRSRDVAGAAAAAAPALVMVWRWPCSDSGLRRKKERPASALPVPIGAALAADTAEPSKLRPLPPLLALRCRRKEPEP